jgi:hypothetical protein
MKTIYHLKHYIVLVSLIVFTIRAAGQVSSVDTNTYGFKSNAALVAKLKLPNLYKEHSDFHFRLYDSGDVSALCIDIYKTSDSAYHSTVTLYTYEYVDEAKEKPTHRLYKRSISMTSEQANKAFNALLASDVLKLPTDTAIKGWQHGYDGVTYDLELRADNEYAFKSYWTPASQDVQEAQTLKNTIDSLYSILEVKKLLASFGKQIPFEQHYVYGSSVSVRPSLTIEQLKQYKKERDVYRKQTHIQ